jgi:TonB family protein
VLAKDLAEGRARARTLGGHATTGPRHAESFEFDFSGTPGRLTFGPHDICLLKVPSIDIEPVLQRFAIMLQLHRPGWDYDFVDTRGMDFADYADDQSRPSLDGEPPSDAVVRYRVEVVSAESRNVRLLVLSRKMTSTRGSMFLVSEIHADAAERPPPTLPQPYPQYHSFDTLPSEDISGRLAYPPHYPAAALKACVYGLVRLYIRIDAKGTLQAVSIDKSSGSSDLDAAALDAAQHWKFNSGIANGHPVGGEFFVPVNFANPCPVAR